MYHRKYSDQLSSTTTDEPDLTNKFHKEHTLAKESADETFFYQQWKCLDSNTPPLPLPSIDTRINVVSAHLTNFASWFGHE